MKTKRKTNPLRAGSSAARNSMPGASCWTSFAIGEIGAEGPLIGKLSSGELRKGILGWGEALERELTEDSLQGRHFGWTHGSKVSLLS